MQRRDILLYRPFAGQMGNGKLPLKDNDRRNMPKYVGSDPRPAPGASPSLPPGGIFPQDYPPLLLGPAIVSICVGHPYPLLRFFGLGRVLINAQIGGQLRKARKPRRYLVSDRRPAGVLHSRPHLLIPQHGDGWSVYVTTNKNRVEDEIERLEQLKRGQQ